MKWNTFDEIKAPKHWLEQAKALEGTKVLQKRPWTRITKAALAAACVCAALVGTAFAANSLFGIELFGTINQPGYSTYYIQADVKLHKIEEFSGALQTDLKNGELNWAQDSLQSAVDYVGLPVLSNDLLAQGQEGVISFDAPYIVQGEQSVDKARNDLVEAGSPEQIKIRYQKIIDHVIVDISINAYTEYADLSNGILGVEWVEPYSVYDADGNYSSQGYFSHDFISQNYTMNNGDTAIIVSSANDGYLQHAYFVHDGLLYSIILVGIDTRDAPHPDFSEFIKQILDSYY